MTHSEKLEVTVTRWLSVRAEGRVALIALAVLVVCATTLGIFYIAGGR